MNRAELATALSLYCTAKDLQDSSAYIISGDAGEFPDVLLSAARPYCQIAADSESREFMGMLWDVPGMEKHVGEKVYLALLEPGCTLPGTMRVQPVFARQCADVIADNSSGDADADTDGRKLCLQAFALQTIDDYQTLH